MEQKTKLIPIGAAENYINIMKFVNQNGVELIISVNPGSHVNLLKIDGEINTSLETFTNRKKNKAKPVGYKIRKHGNSWSHERDGKEERKITPTLEFEGTYIPFQIDDTCEFDEIINGINTIRCINYIIQHDIITNGQHATKSPHFQSSYSDGKCDKSLFISTDEDLIPHIMIVNLGLDRQKHNEKLTEYRTRLRMYTKYFDILQLLDHYYTAILDAFTVCFKISCRFPRSCAIWENITDIGKCGNYDRTIRIRDYFPFAGFETIDGNCRQCNVYVMKLDPPHRKGRWNLMCASTDDMPVLSGSRLERINFNLFLRKTTPELPKS